LVYIFTLLLWAATFIARLKFNGSIFNLDFGLYHPDGSLYTFRTLTFLGFSEHDAGLQVSKWYATHSSKLGIIDPSTLYFDSNPNWAQYKQRILYPLLSVPFVALFGIPGMLIVPALSLLILMLLTAYLGHKYHRQYLAGIINIVFISSISITRWMISNTTDAVLIIWVVLFLIALFSRYSLKYRVVIAVTAVLLASSTRFCLLLWIFIAIYLWKSKEKEISVATLAAALIGFIPIITSPFSHAVLPEKSDSNLLSKLLSFPFATVRAFFYEIAELFVIDKVLFFGLFLTVIFALIKFNRKTSKLFIGTFIALILTAGINGVIGVNFRYYLPLLPFASIALLNRFHEIS